MNGKKYAIIGLFNLSMLMPLYSAQQAPACNNSCTTTQGEDDIALMTEPCPQAINLLTREILKNNPTITWQELLDLYTVKHGTTRFLDRSQLPMIKAMWQDIQLEKYTPLRHQAKYIFRMIPESLWHIIENVKNNLDQQNCFCHKALIINFSLCSCDENKMPEQYVNFIASQMGLSEKSVYDDGTYLFTLYQNQKQPTQRIVHIDRVKPRIFQEAKAYPALQNIIEKYDFVIFSPRDISLSECVKNNPNIAIINIPTPNKHDRLVTLIDLIKRYNCPVEIVRNLNTINQLMPLNIRSKKSPYWTLDCIIKKAIDIFLTDGHFDRSKTEAFFKDEHAVLELQIFPGQ